MQNLLQIVGKGNIIQRSNISDRNTYCDNSNDLNLSIDKATDVMTPSSPN